MPPEDLDIVDSFNIRVRDSGNTTTTNTATIGADLENVGNVDDSVDNSVDVEVDVVDSGNVDSHDQDWDIDGSFNSEEDWSVNDDSVNAGVREYNTSVGDLHLGGVGGGGGDVWVESETSIFDQSVNQNLASGGEVNQLFVNSSVISSGEGSLAIGGDYTSTQSLDASTNITADGGEINIGNDTDVSVAVNSGNSFTDSSSDIDNSLDVDVDDSFNDESTNVSFEESFNDEFTSTETADWDIDADLIWGSDDVAIVDDVAVELPPV